MNTNLKKTIASGIIGITALGGAAFALPGLASAQDDVTPDADTPELVTPEGDRESRRAERLQGLIDDGIITQEQADAIGERVGDRRGHNRRGHRNLSTVAEVLGVTAEDLRDSLGNGDTLADVADAQGVSVDALTAALVDAKTEKIAEKVEAGRITQEQADAKLAELEARIEAKINGERSERNGGGISGSSAGVLPSGDLGA